ncbi:hypothetical protein BD311DRAFT_464192 [Dichomitus squalens]|uniref:Uncharacterized protein n=1 Tax=Dichomitus squalens TaxID=114155 RepID=A0A4Q9MGR2_9APHY|nr:hypothetical protein BD311DRAFT_464192 [Dichomitus squalens]
MSSHRAPRCLHDCTGRDHTSAIRRHLPSNRHVVLSPTRGPGCLTHHYVHLPAAGNTSGTIVTCPDSLLLHRDATRHSMETPTPIFPGWHRRQYLRALCPVSTRRIFLPCGCCLWLGRLSSQGIKMKLFTHFLHGVRHVSTYKGHGDVPRNSSRVLLALVPIPSSTFATRSPIP